MRGVVRRAAPPFPAVLNKFIFKGSRGGFVVLVPQGPENVLRPGLMCRRQRKAQNSGCHGQRALTHQPLPAQPRARRTRLRCCLSQVLSGVLNFLSPAGAGRGAGLTRGRSGSQGATLDNFCRLRDAEDTQRMAGTRRRLLVTTRIEDDGGFHGEARAPCQQAWAPPLIFVEPTLTCAPP